MKRYIDANAIRLTALSQVDSNGDVLVSLQDVRNALAQTPTAEVIEVVRCKNCKWWEEEGIDYLTQRPFGSCKCQYWEHPTEYFSMSDNDYCSYGERRANDGT